MIGPRDDEWPDPIEKLGQDMEEACGPSYDDDEDDDTNNQDSNDDDDDG